MSSLHSTVRSLFSYKGKGVWDKAKGAAQGDVFCSHHDIGGMVAKQLWLQAHSMTNNILKKAGLLLATRHARHG
jgi:hypothetical protein